MTHVVFIVAAFVCLHVACDAIYLDRSQLAIRSDAGIPASVARYPGDPHKRNQPTIIIIRGRGQQGAGLQLSAPPALPPVKVQKPPRQRNIFRDLMMADMYDLPYIPGMNFFGSGRGASGSGSNNFFNRYMMMDALDLPFMY